MAIVDPLRNLAVVGQQVVVVGASGGVEEVEGVGPEIEAGQIPMLNPDRSPVGRIRGHGLDDEGRGLDGGDDVPAARPTDAVGMAIGSGEGDLARSNQGVGRVLGPDELRQRRLAHGPPRVGGIKGGQNGRQIVADRQSIVPAGEGGVQPLEALPARFQRSFRLAAAAVPRLEIAEHGGHPGDRVDPGIGQIQARQRSEAAVDERRQIEGVEVAALTRTPQGAVGQQLGPHVGHRVPQGAANSRRVGVLLNVPRQRTDGLIAPLGALGPDPPEGPVGLLDDLLEGPPLQIDLVIGHDPLAAADLPGVGLGVGHQAVGVLELEHGAGGGVVRPRLLSQEPHRRLVPVEGGAQLDLLHQGPGPIVRVAGFDRRQADRGHLLGGRLELLLRNQFLHIVPGHGRCLPGGDSSVILLGQGHRVQAGGEGEDGQKSDKGGAAEGCGVSHGTSLESFRPSKFQLRPRWPRNSLRRLRELR